MIVHDVVQGSPEWFACHIGLPTASAFDRIITPTGKPSTQADGYANELLAEMMAGEPLESFSGSEWMLRGKELEADAAAFYEMTVNEEMKVIGFCTDDAKTMGCSPDRLVGEDGLLEIKIPKPKNHISYMLKQNLKGDHYPQSQGQLLVTKRKWVDMLSYHPKMPPVIIRVERDESYIATMKGLLSDFIFNLNKKRLRLIELGYMDVNHG